MDTDWKSVAFRLPEKQWTVCMQQGLELSRYQLATQQVGEPFQWLKTPPS